MGGMKPMDENGRIGAPEGAKHPDWVAINRSCSKILVVRGIPKVFANFSEE